MKKITRGMSVVAFATLSILGGTAWRARSVSSVEEPVRGWTAAGDSSAAAIQAPPQAIGLPVIGQAVSTPAEPEMAALYEALGTDAIGERAKAGIAAFRADAMARGANAHFEDSLLVRVWKADPVNGLVDIEALLARLDSAQYSALKTQLLRAAAQIGGDRETVQAIAADSMRDPVAIAWGREDHDVEEVSPYLPMITEAVRTMIQASQESPDVAIRAALDAMQAHADVRTQAGIRASLEVAFPTMSAAIDAAMAQRGIAEPETILGRQVLASRR